MGEKGKKKGEGEKRKLQAIFWLFRPLQSLVLRLTIKGYSVTGFLLKVIYIIFSSGKWTKFAHIAPET